MSLEAVQQTLEAKGIWNDRLELEPFEWLTEQGPTEALMRLEAYRLIRPRSRRELDKRSRNWQPILAVGGEVMIDPSPEMFGRMLAESGYFEQPEAFGQLLLLQFHRFALDYYQDYQVRETDIQSEGETLVVRGQAHRGRLEESFTTRANTDGTVIFKVG